MRYIYKRATFVCVEMINCNDLDDKITMNMSFFFLKRFIWKKDN